MNTERKVALLEAQIASANGGYPSDFDEWRNRTRVVLRKVLGDDHDLVTRFNSVRYSPTMWVAGMDTSGYRPAGVRSAVTIIRAAQDEVRLDDELQTSAGPAAEATTDADGINSVFIVHGHDTALRESVARVLRAALGFEPTILHEVPNRGRVLQTKFADTSDAIDYAVVLLTSDDVGKAKDGKDTQPRGRQNVVFEFGYFAGLLGWDRVVVIYEPGVELPSDLDGLVYIEADQRRAWRNELLRELADAGAEVDWSSLGR